MVISDSARQLLPEVLTSKIRMLGFLVSAVARRMNVLELLEGWRLGEGSAVPEPPRESLAIVAERSPRAGRHRDLRPHRRRLEMRKLRIFEHISLDGIIEPGGAGEYRDWTAPYRSPAGLELVIAEQGTSFDLLLGRRTYDLWAGYWPKAAQSLMADLLNAATKYVATHRPESLAWGPAEELGADILEGVRRVKSKDGPDLIVWGSSTLTSVLLEQGLADEVVLIVYPLLLGRGKRFFSEDAAPRELALVSTKATPTGVLLNTYRHVGALVSG
jgi:dihydrofolate reductase